MQEDLQRISASDGTELAVRRWSTQGVTKACRTLLLLHGIGFHSDPYRILAEHVLPPAGPVDDLVIYAPDVRGHGRSGGRRGDLAGHDVIVDDVAVVYEHMRREHPDARPFILGESMGALFALGFIAERRPEPAGLILIAPALELRPAHILSGNVFAFARSVASFGHEPTISLGGRLLEISSRDCEFKAHRGTDPVSLHSVSAHYLWTLWSFNRRWRSWYPKHLTFPLLIVQGGQDQLLVVKHATELYRSSATRDKDLLLLPSACHTLFWDPDAPEVFERIGRWLDER